VRARADWVFLGKPGNTPVHPIKDGRDNVKKINNLREQHRDGNLGFASDWG